MGGVTAIHDARRLRSDWNGAAAGDHSIETATTVAKAKGRGADDGSDRGEATVVSEPSSAAQFG